MAFSEMNDELDIIARYPDEPYEEEGFTSAAFKASFDRGAKLCKAAHNVLVQALNAVGAAASVGFRRSTAVPADNVQAAIENVQGQITGVSQGAVPNGSITTEKLHKDSVTSEKIPFGGLLEDVTEDVNLQSAFSAGDTQTLKFYYCRALGIVIVKGSVTRNQDSEAPSDTSSWLLSSYRPKDSLTGLTGNWVGNPVQVNVSRFSQIAPAVDYLTVRFPFEEPYPEEATAQIIGWYFCDEPEAASEEE